jgi:toxin ParE1/3/4
MTSSRLAVQNIISLEIKAAAEADLAEIWDYSVEQFGIDVAEAYFKGFYESFEQLKRFPKLGEAVARIKPEMRCLVHRSHRIFYRFVSGGISIERILHRAMDARSQLN